MNHGSFLIGIGVGAGVVAIIVFSIFQINQSETAGVEGSPSNSTQQAEDRAFVYLPGLLKEIRNDTMIVDQTFGNPTLTKDNPEVKVQVQFGTAFYECIGEDSQACSRIQYDNVVDNPSFKGIHLCSTGPMKNGILYGGKIFLNATCSWQAPPPSEP